MSEGANTAERLEAARQEVAEATTQALFEAHPGWRDRWGPDGLEHTQQDVSFTVAFLAAAIREDHPEIFEAYVAWLRSVLEPRGVDADVIEATHEALADQLDERLPEADAARALEVLRAGNRALEGPLEDAEEPAAPPGSRTEALAEALLEGSYEAARAVVQEALDEGASPTDVADTLVAPAMYEVGRRWQGAEITVADEHLATALARRLVVDLYAQRAFPGEASGRALLACVEGCEHSLGIQMVADRFEEAGWEARCLGADVPADDLVAHAERWRPDVVGLSVSMPHQLAAARRTVEGLREALPDHDLKILVGGQLVRRFPHLGQVLRVDAQAASSGEAVEAVPPIG